MSVKRALEVLKNERVFLNQPKNWNDPFEVAGDIYSSYSKIHKIEEDYVGTCFTNAYSQEDLQEPLLSHLLWGHYGDKHQGV